MTNLRIYYVYDSELTDESFYGEDDVAVVRADEAKAEIKRLREALKLAIHRGQFDRGTAVALKDALAEADA